MSKDKENIKNQFDVLFQEDDKSLKLSEIARQDKFMDSAYMADRRYV